MSPHSVSSPPAQLTTEELRQLRWLLGGLLTLLGVSTVAYMDVAAWGLMTVTGLVSLATTLWPTLPARVPRVAHVLAFPFIASFFALDLWLHSELLPAMVRLDMLLLLYRALVYRQRRDDLQLVILGLFLVVIAGVLTVSLLFAAQILVYTACALVFLLLLTLGTDERADTESPAAPGAGEPRPEAGSRRVAPAWAQRTDWRRLVGRVAAATDWRVVLLSAGLFAGVVAGSAVLFMIIPRFQLDNGLFLDRFITKKARTGFSDSIKFGDVSEIQQDNGVALHVDVSDPGQIPLAPYWRMLVLDTYEQGTFRMSPALRSQRFAHPRTGTMLFGTGRARREHARWTIFMEPGVSRYLPLLGLFQQLRFAEAQTYQSSSDLALVALTKDPVTMTAYQVEAFDLSARVKDLPAGFYSEPSSSRRLERDDQLALRRVATEITGGAELRPGEFAAKAGAWLRDRHAYSLSPQIPDGRGDPLVRWLTSRGAGHCELFAGSFVLLARSAGFNARIVTGFRGGTWNGFSNSFTIRNSDAHAWAEIYDRDSGSWLRADPLELPGAGQTQEAADGVRRARTDRSWAARLDSLRVFWYRRVVSFDEQTQVQTLKVAKELAQSSLLRLKERFTGSADAFKAWLARPLDLRRATELGLVAVALLAVILGWRRGRLWLLRLSARRRGARGEDPIRREAGRWLKRLNAAPALPSSAAAVVPDLQRLRFGRRRTWPDPTPVFREARTAMKHAERAKRRNAATATPPCLESSEHEGRG